MNFLDLNCSEPNKTNVTYTIETPLVPFIINANGMISANSTLDYEQTTNYTLSVTCSDPAEPTQVGRTTVHIWLTPVNEFRPEFTPSTALAVFVAETEPAGTVLFSRITGRGRETYTVIDHDAGSDGDIFFTLNSPDDPEIEEYFTINRTTGDIAIKQILDIDNGANTTFTIKFTACDYDPPNDTCPNKVVTIFVTPENDNYPQFAEQFYQVVVPENTTEGAIVLMTICTDADKPIDTALNIGFQNTDEVGFTPLTEVTQAFSVNPNTGSIVVVSIDYERMQNYTFKLICNDSFGYSNITTVFIEVSNEADEVPIFSQVQIMQTFIIATYPPGTQVAAIWCIDGDVAINASISYSIFDPSGQFSIQDDGRLVVNSTLQQFATYMMRYEVIVICSETVPPYLVANTSLLLKVIKNDTTPPSISPPLPIGGRFSVLENATVGHVLAVFSATDSDSPGVEFSIRGNTAGNTFSINSTTGMLIVESSLDRETVSSYFLVVTVTEERLLPGEAQSSSIEIEISIGDVNDNSPTCGQNEPETSFEAGRHDSITVYTLSCSDRDLGQNSELSYCVDSTVPSVSAGQFSVSGPALIFDGTAEGDDAFTVIIVISDSGSPQLSTTLRVKVNVTGSAGFTFPLFIVIIVIIVVAFVVLALLILCVVIGSVYWDNHRKKYKHNNIVGYVTCLP